MNKQTVFNLLLAAAVIALFVLHFVAPQKSATEEVQINGEHMPIAFVNSDSILAQYTFAVEANDRLMSKQEDATVKLNDRYKAFQREYDTFTREAADFQKKVESGAFLTRERAESEQARLQKKQEGLLKKQQELENLQAQLREDFLTEQDQLTRQLQDSVRSFLKEFNKEGRYHLIVNDAILMDKVAGYDITDEVVAGLNTRYGK